MTTTRKTVSPAKAGIIHGATAWVIDKWVPAFAGTTIWTLLLTMLLCGAVPAAARAPVILAFGDSLTAGLGLAPNETFPVRLEARLRADGIEARVVNGGMSGDTTTGGLARLDWALAGKPDIVILELGANDTLRGIEPRIVRANLDAMLTKIQDSGAKVLLTGMRALANWGADYQHAFESIYPELARAHGVALYPFFLDGVAMDPELNQPDGLHPNGRGVAALVDRIAPYVARVIQSRLTQGSLIGVR
jgi:acyl-CoA thioesterase-1